MRVCTTPVAVYIDSVKACEYRYVDRVVPDTEWEERVCAAYFFFFFFLSRVRLQPRTHVHDMPLMCLYMTTYLYMHIY